MIITGLELLAKPVQCVYRLGVSLLRGKPIEAFRLLPVLVQSTTANFVKSADAGLRLGASLIGSEPMQAQSFFLVPFDSTPTDLMEETKAKLCRRQALSSGQSVKGRRPLWVNE